MISLEGLDSEELKERLIIAETLMKKLYNRNKVLEEYHSDTMLTKKQQTLTTDNSSIVDKGGKISENKDLPLFAAKEAEDNKKPAEN